ncbi:MAG: trans-aconitate 2-methyltransferase [Alphaproteobacteria bacterium]|nr:trans-aconitate 2-methyltransferase [Alphaproteobacteria bacterium]
MSWNPDVYLSFAGERTRPAADLLARVPPGERWRITDLGCGPGNSTALLAARYPAAELTGLDNSPARLEKARTEGPPGVTWREADAASWSPDRPQDLIFSNALFQWVPAHGAIFSRLMETMPLGGVLAVQMPRNFNEPSHRIIREVAQSEKWASKLAALGLREPVLPPEAYFEILKGHAASIDIWETVYVQALNGEDPVLDWIKGTALTPYLAALDHRQVELFLEELAVKLREAYPRSSSGITLFPFRRVFIVATR